MVSTTRCTSSATLRSRSGEPSLPWNIYWPRCWSRFCDQSAGLQCRAAQRERRLYRCRWWRCGFPTAPHHRAFCVFETGGKIAFKFDTARVGTGSSFVATSFILTLATAAILDSPSNSSRCASQVSRNRFSYRDSSNHAPRCSVGQGFVTINCVLVTYLQTTVVFGHDRGMLQKMGFVVLLLTAGFLVGCGTSTLGRVAAKSRHGQAFRAMGTRVPRPATMRSRRR